MIGEDKSTDSSSSKYVISDDPITLHEKDDIMERPTSNPFSGEKISEHNENEFFDLFQGIIFSMLFVTKLGNGSFFVENIKSYIRFKSKSFDNKPKCL